MPMNPILEPSFPFLLYTQKLKLNFTLVFMLICILNLRILNLYSSRRSFIPNYREEGHFLFISMSSRCLTLNKKSVMCKIIFTFTVKQSLFDRLLKNILKLKFYSNFAKILTHFYHINLILRSNIIMMMKDEYFHEQNNEL